MKNWFSRGGMVRRAPAVIAVLIVLLLLLGIAAFLIIRPDDPFRASAITNPPFPSLTYGVQTFLWWDENVASIHLAWTRMIGFSHVKQIFAWDDMETEQGEWSFTASDRIVNEVERYGLHLVVRLSDAPDWAHPAVEGVRHQDYIDAPPDADHLDVWANYCSTIAARYRGRIDAYQIWNEPNLAREWGNNPPDAPGYTELLRVCSEAIRAADADAIIISAGLSPTGSFDNTAVPDDRFLQALYWAGFQQYIDVVGMHAPGYRAPEYGPDDAERDDNGRWSTFRRVEDLRRIMIDNGDAARQVAILEVGWTTDPRTDSSYNWFAVTQEQQADYLVRAYQYAYEHWRPWVGLMSTIYIANPAWTPDDEEYWWAITENVDWSPPGVPRPAYLALGNMAKYCGDVIIPERGADYQLPTDIMQVPICGG
ncbi:MAG: hypothetical protein U0694_06005 [Anaerolineae bacterium]